MPTPELTAFGQAVRAARVKEGLKLSELSVEIYGDDGRKGYLSQVENGKRKLSPLTIGKIAEQLEIDGPVLDRALGLDLPADDPPTQVDAQASELLSRAKQAEGQLKLAESLVISLAYRFAETNPTDLDGAIAGLTQALEAADRLAEAGARPSNHPDFIDEVFREAARLNAEDRSDDAAEAFEEALKREEEESTARQQKLLHGLKDQHILRGDAEGLVAVQERLLRLDGLTGADLYHALRGWGVERAHEGERLGTPFDLRVAVACFTACAPPRPRRRMARRDPQRPRHCPHDPRERGDTDALHRAVTAFEDALTVSTREAIPAKRAMTRGNMASAYCALAEAEPEKASTHIAAGLPPVDDALSIFTEDTAPAYFEVFDSLRSRLLALRDAVDP